MSVSDDEIQIDYKSRINSVFEFIEDNLDGDLSLSRVSAVALYSPFHFHRIFKVITGETVNEYITRRRLEKSALDLLHKNMEVTEIALKVGYNNTSTFSRAFKRFYGVSPTDFKKQNPNKFSKIRQVNSKNSQAYPDFDKYICIINNLKTWIEVNAKIEIKETPALTLPAISHIGISGIEQAFEKLIKWANPKGLMKNPEAKLGRMFYDSFKVTAPDKVRMRIFLTTNESFEPEGEVSKLTINKGRCIVGRFEITPNEFEKSWSGLFIWMSENGYKKSAEHPYEIYQNDFRTHPENKFIVDFYIPIE